MNITNHVSDIATLQRESIIHWKKEGVHLTHDHFLKLVEENHAFNFQLWHAEDRARRDDLGHEMVYLAKREIDHCNQQRNNRMESIDEWCVNAFQPASHLQCPVHSETPGMMIDRLSIMALKAYHMGLQATRQEVDSAHREACLSKLHVIEEQQRQLLSCLEDLLQDVINKTRTFRVYHQFKMYNDATLNPELYQNQSQKLDINGADSLFR